MIRHVTRFSGLSAATRRLVSLTSRIIGIAAILSAAHETEGTRRRRIGKSKPRPTRRCLARAQARSSALKGNPMNRNRSHFRIFLKSLQIFIRMLPMEIFRPLSADMHKA
jgi:hypothetical protein